MPSPSRKCMWLGYRGWDIEYDECNKNGDRGENLDDQDENIPLNDEFRLRRVQIA